MDGSRKGIQSVKQLAVIITKRSLLSDLDQRAAVNPDKKAIYTKTV